MTSLFDPVIQTIMLKMDSSNRLNNIRSFVQTYTYTYKVWYTNQQTYQMPASEAFTLHMYCNNNMKIKEGTHIDHVQYIPHFSAQGFVLPVYHTMYSHSNERILGCPITHWDVSSTNMVSAGRASGTPTSYCLDDKAINRDQSGDGSTVAAVAAPDLQAPADYGSNEIKVIRPTN